MEQQYSRGQKNILFYLQCFLRVTTSVCSGCLLRLYSCQSQHDKRVLEIALCNVELCLISPASNVTLASQRGQNQMHGSHSSDRAGERMVLNLRSLRSEKVSFLWLHLQASLMWWVLSWKVVHAEVLALLIMASMKVWVEYEIMDLVVLREGVCVTGAWSSLILFINIRIFAGRNT